MRSPTAFHGLQYRHSDYRPGSQQPVWRAEHQLAHLAPFVDVSRKKIYAEVQEEVKTFGCMPSEEAIHEVVENRLRKEVTKGVQTIQYQSSR